MKYDNIFIMGGGSVISGNAGNRDEKKWVLVNSKSKFYAQDLTVKKFNTALTCSEGVAYLKNINFKENSMHYLIQRDWGAAIEYCYSFLRQLYFMNNHAKNGGAIFSQGFLSLKNNTIFSGNEAYGKGNDICVGDGGKVEIDGKNITSDTKNIVFAKSLSQTQQKWMKIVCIAASAGAGFLTGVFTANPVAGIAVGVSVGAGLGVFTSAKLAASIYNVNYNRVLNSVILIAESMAAGAAGGIAGYYASGASAAIESASSPVSDSSLAMDSSMTLDSSIYNAPSMVEGSTSFSELSSYGLHEVYGFQTPFEVGIDEMTEVELIHNLSLDSVIDVFPMVG